MTQEAPVAPSEILGREECALSCWKQRCESGAARCPYTELENRDNTAEGVGEHEKLGPDDTEHLDEALPEVSPSGPVFDLRQ